MSDVKTVFSVRIYPHPSKRKEGPRNEKLEVPGYGQQAATIADKHYREQGLRATKVLAGFVIDGQTVEADLTSPYDKPSKR